MITLASGILNYIFEQTQCIILLKIETYIRVISLIFAPLYDEYS